ncbi:MAG: hypothetical protein ACK2UH_13490, partial [Candidatus Promineifilaceae bacterium]
WEMSEESKAEELLYFNGIDVTTGDYDLNPMSSEELWRKLKGEDQYKTMPEGEDELALLKHRKNNPSDFALEEDRDPMSLDSSGWGVIFAADADPAVKEALSALLEWRKKQAGDLFRVYEGPDGYRPGESKNSFLTRFGAGPGPVNPEKVPYYLMIVGSPDKIPYRFQTQLDVQYAVGRIHFDTLEEYANYAQSVVTAESGEVKLPRRGAFFGAANKDDKATQLSAKKLVTPLFEEFAGKEYQGWRFDSFMAEQADKAQLEKLLGGDQTPSLLFTASHGASFPMGDKRQRAHNGALICQNWPGPRDWREPLKEEFYFAGDHLDSSRNLLGMIAFFFACYGGGTPRMDEFSAQAFRDSRRQIAPNSFLAQLPSRMLSQPKGGALAVIGHVERAWGYSFVWPNAGEQTGVFEDTLKRLLKGCPVGYAFEWFNDRYAALATVLSDALEDIKWGGKEDPFEMVGMWTANNDARGYAIIGDPAVRLPVAGEGEASNERPEIVVNFKAPPGQETAEAAGAAVAKTGAASAAEEKTDAADAATGFAPLPELGERLATAFPELEKKMVEDWVLQIARGYENHQQVFQRILDTFLNNHRATVIMYWILFLVGIGLFVTAAVLGVVLEDFVPAAIFGGLGVVSFLSFFVGRSLQSVEENLEYITWLGIIYNTYWT